MDIPKSVKYFKSLIDENGILQFTKINTKDYKFGYAIEDQARALILCLRLGDRDLAEKFLGLILESVNKKGDVAVLRDSGGNLSKRTDNFCEAGAEVFWALLEYNFFHKRGDLVGVISKMKKKLLANKYPRVLAYTILGLEKLKDKQSLEKAADTLIQFYQKNSAQDWKWFENQITYANALLPLSLFSAYVALRKDKYLKVAIETLGFLFENLSVDNKPIVVGNRGWWFRGGKISLFDQQTIDVSYLVLTCLKAFEITQDRMYLQKARFYYSWFEGNNLTGNKMIREDGGCYDGLTPDGPNLNAGAESIICYLLASVELKNVESR